MVLKITNVLEVGPWTLIMKHISHGTYIVYYWSDREKGRSSLHFPSTASCLLHPQTSEDTKAFYILLRERHFSAIIHRCRITTTFLSPIDFLLSRRSKLTKTFKAQYLKQYLRTNIFYFLVHKSTHSMKNSICTNHC